MMEFLKTRAFVPDNPKVVLKNPISRFLKTRVSGLGQRNYAIVRSRFLKTRTQPVYVGPKVGLIRLIPEVGS